MGHCSTVDYRVNERLPVDGQIERLAYAHIVKGRHADVQRHVGAQAGRYRLENLEPAHVADACHILRLDNSVVDLARRQPGQGDRILGQKAKFDGLDVRRPTASELRSPGKIGVAFQYQALARGPLAHPVGTRANGLSTKGVAQRLDCGPRQRLEITSVGQIVQQPLIRFGQGDAEGKIINRLRCDCRSQQWRRRGRPGRWVHHALQGPSVIGRSERAAIMKGDARAQLEVPDEAVVGGLPALGQVGHNLALGTHGDESGADKGHREFSGIHDVVMRIKRFRLAARDHQGAACNRRCSGHRFSRNDAGDFLFNGFGSPRDDHRRDDAVRHDPGYLLLHSLRTFCAAR